MRLLLDTHTFLWFISGSPNLSARARAVIEDGGSERFVIAASLWEIAIKVSIGKLALAESFGTLVPCELQAGGMSVLPVKVEHLARLTDLPRHHGDPFDRLLAAQALVESMHCVSADEKLDAPGMVMSRWEHSISAKKTRRIERREGTICPQMANCLELTMLAIDLDSTTEERLERLAKKTGRSKSSCAQEAIAEYLEELKDADIALEPIENPAKTY